MRIILLICIVLLLLALVELPIGYYTLLRTVVSVGAAVVLVTELENGVNFWVITFGIIAIIFNPLIPVCLRGKSEWMPIDLITAILFAIKYLKIKDNKI